MRRFQVRLRWWAVAVLLAVALAVCGSGRETDNTGAVDPDGVLRYGYPMPVAGLHFDPARTVVLVDTFWMSLVYGSLLEQTADGSIEPGMAEAAEVVDPQTVRITLRPGVKFSDGAAYGAAAVRTSLLRARTPATPAARAQQDPTMKALADVEVVDPLTVTVRLGAPLAGQFLVEMTQRHGSIVSPRQIAGDPDAIDTRPIGAGPFTLVENVPQQRLVLRRNPGHWAASEVRLGGVDIVKTPAGPQQANGLLSKTVDWASYLPVDTAKPTSDGGRYTTAVTTVHNIELALCTGQPPFDDERFRKAVQLGIDRSRFAELAFGGMTEPAFGSFRESSKNFAPAVKDLVTHDPQRAKQLLAAAGASGTTFDLHYSSTLDLGRGAEIVQSQVAEIGVVANVDAQRDAYSAFVVPQAPGALLTAAIGGVGYHAFAWHFGKGGALALCGVDRPDVMQAVNQATGRSPDDPAAVAAYQRAQELVAEPAYVVPVVAFPTVAGWNAAWVRGTPVFDALGHPQLEQLSIAG